mmetsp:Transcript_2771/g.5989  ORF Transcript_2771/g.5989 Transcript_2771/m.5989 type:complete len:183 (-) Transcript_2771:1165-1713(-)|eukprot:CAMPEP_0171339138 /NCGR_PEP_ID=MMETSP0878-20121228/7760_1 /TAXON_ID=67004 /ORGANISM="Thalassiosira weissflogii, Strain CCMP1336" /LENGTH=182 /DNA_ID=CAMNT_0011841007 /DNA_START=34 /DNA_END=582 /DNA_ORIENTATION=+
MSSDNSGGNAINIDTMSLDQLNHVKSQQEARLEQLTAQYHQLRAVSARLSTARTAVSSIPLHSSSSSGGGGSSSSGSSGEGGRDIMIPLTESLYAPGKIIDPNKILVELGAGFFVEKSAKDAAKVLERKAKVVDANSENVMMAAEATSRNVEAVRQAMQGKMIEIQARQQGLAYKNQVDGKQ